MENLVYIINLFIFAEWFINLIIIENGNKVYRTREFGDNQRNDLPRAAQRPERRRSIYDLLGVYGGNRGFAERGAAFYLAQYVDTGAVFVSHLVVDGAGMGCVFCDETQNRPLGDSKNPYRHNYFFGMESLCYCNSCFSAHDFRVILFFAGRKSLLLYD
jgi:hypothetical protein